MTPEQEISKLKKEIVELKATIVDLDAAAEAGAELMLRVLELEEELEKYQKPKMK